MSVGTRRDHSECPAALLRAVAEQGMEVTISTEPPIVVGPYTVQPLVCQHGVQFWIEPTGEQIAAWAAGGVA